MLKKGKTQSKGNTHRKEFLKRTFKVLLSPLSDPFALAKKADAPNISLTNSFRKKENLNSIYINLMFSWVANLHYKLSR